jgi:hypothetical protein
MIEKFEIGDGLEWSEDTPQGKINQLIEDNEKLWKVVNKQKRMIINLYELSKLPREDEGGCYCHQAKPGENYSASGCIHCNTAPNNRAINLNK